MTRSKQDPSEQPTKTTSEEGGFEFGTPTSRSSQRSPLTMALLFYLVTAGAILSACLRTLATGNAVTNESFQRMLVICIACGFFSGGIIGFYYLKGRLATIILSFMGAIVGAVAGGLALVRGEHFAEMAFIAFGGCWLLILIMLVSARLRTASV